MFDSDYHNYSDHLLTGTTIEQLLEISISPPHSEASADWSEISLSPPHSEGLADWLEISQCLLTVKPLLFGWRSRHVSSQCSPC